MSRLEELRSRIAVLGRESEQALAALQNLQSCEAFRIEFLGKKGKISTLFDTLKLMPDGERPLAGQLINTLKARVEAALEAKKTQLAAAEVETKLRQEAVDVTLPGRPVSAGRLHIITQTLREIYQIFTQMGFQIVESPEVETDEYNFQLLNIPPDHPARDMWSTFYTTNGLLLRTHTSPGQIHAMRKYAPEPIRVILPGKCYRYEQVTARSEFMFYQVEGLAIGRHITLGDLKGVLTEFAREFFGRERQVRFRASYFPFTEPSLELDMDCIICGGAGCGVCKQTGWVEILGAGMVHPRVLENGGYDPKIFSGFAFGMGPERIAMLRHRIDDIRLFYSNDLRFLAQFG